MSSIAFVYDITCPYSYLASTQIESLAAGVGATVAWRPVVVRDLVDANGGRPDPTRGVPAPKATLRARDVARWAELMAVPLRAPVAGRPVAVHAMRLCAAAPPERRAAVSHALFDAQWVQGRDVTDRRVVAEAARAQGLSASAIDATDPTAALREASRWAQRRGVFDVPTFVVGARLWWGFDRLGLVVAALGGDAAVDRSPRPASTGTASGRVRVDFIHDFASPFSYLAATAVHAVAARHGVDVAWMPVLLGALFAAIGTANVPLFTMSAAHQAYVRRDLQDWAAARGVPFRFPTHFPMRSVLPLRVALAAPHLTPALYRAAWAQDRRIDDPEALAAVLAEAGAEPDAWIAAAQDPACKAALRSNTAQAQALGACGVPTVVIHDAAREHPLLLWGQDRLGMLDAVLSGWWPAGE